MTSARSHLRPATGFLALLARREFGVLWLADAQSLLGDQLARVALAVLVFDRTRSGLTTAAVYALTFLPALVGSFVLGPLADRVPRRRLLVGGDLLRAGCLAAMALPRAPLGVVAALLVVAVLAGSPWKAAQRALVADILPPEDYVTGSGFRTATTQATQVIGFAVGGLVVAAIGPHNALGVDAVTFAVSAALIRLGVRARPAAHLESTDDAGRWLDGTRAVLGDPRLRLLLALSWLLGVIVVPEGLAAPYAAHLGGGSGTVGVLLAAMPAGVLVGTLVYTRLLGEHARARLLGPLAALAGLPLLACGWVSGTVPTVVLWSLAGLCTCYQVQVGAEFVRAVAPAIRGQALSVASGGLLGAQGIGIVAGGGLVTVFAPNVTVAVAGAAAIGSGGWLGMRRRRRRLDHPDEP